MTDNATTTTSASNTTGSLSLLERILQIDTVQLADDKHANTLDIFVGDSPPERFTKHVYGGQLVAQALVAAARTIPKGKVLHSLHCYFLASGDHRERFVYTVERLRDGST